MNNLKMRHVIYGVAIFFTITSLAHRAVYGAGSLHTVDFNYENDLIGDKATGLGGAYCAISDDPSGAYYNPAGLVFASDNQVSLSVNNYKQKHLKIDSAIYESEPYTQKIDSFYPSFFGIVQSISNFKIALTILNINNEILDQDNFYPSVNAPQTGGGTIPVSFNMNYNITDNTVLGGLSLAHFFFSDSLSIGVSCYGLKRRSEEIWNQLQVMYAEDPQSYEISNQYITEDIYGVIGKLGIQWMPSDIISIGTCIGQGMILSHERHSQILNKRFDDTEVSFKIESEKITDDKMPLEARVGVAVFPSKLLLISADLIATTGTQYYQHEVENTFNGALGAEYYITPSLPIRLGLFTNFANTPVIDKNKTDQEMHVDMYGASMSLSWQTKNSSISLSGFYQTGAGKAQVADSNAVQDVSMYMYSISLTGSAKY